MEAKVHRMPLLGQIQHVLVVTRCDDFLGKPGRLQHLNCPASIVHAQSARVNGECEGHQASHLSFSSQSNPSQQAKMIDLLGSA